LRNLLARSGCDERALDIEDLEVTFGRPRRCAALRCASAGETHCLVGESGCGKSVTALA